jgi:hypothetical protein
MVSCCLPLDRTSWVALICLPLLFVLLDRYIVEWEDPSVKKKSQQHRHMYGDKKTEKLKPKNLRQWGTAAPPSAEEHGPAPPKEEHTTSKKNKKSRRERKEEVAKKQSPPMAHPPEESHDEDNINEESPVTVETPEGATSSKAAKEEAAFGDTPKKAAEASKSAGQKKESTLDQFERLTRELSDQVDLVEDVVDANTGTSPYTKYIQHKVKCPKDKKPGDLVEFSNPHIPGQKRTVRIPKDAKPGKFFKLMVPLPAKTEDPVNVCVCCHQQVEEATSTIDDDDKDKFKPIAVPLRSCVHFCCEQCFPTIQGERCPTCKRSLPTMDSLDHLPYIQQLDAPPDSVKEALIEEFYVAKEANRSSAGNKEQDALEDASKTATKAVDKHCRRASLKVHPDRHGEAFRKEFDILVKARDVLRNVELRRKYLDEMFDIVCRVDVEYVHQSHQIWMQKNDPDSAEQNNIKQAPAPGTGPKVPMQLGGGIAFSNPKRPRVFLQNEGHRRIKLYLPLSDEGQFLQYCETVTILGSCGESTYGKGNDPFNGSRVGLIFSFFFLVRRYGGGRNSLGRTQREQARPTGWRNSI